jgi:recombinational DNA repair protein (RecF pathway)
LCPENQENGQVFSLLKETLGRLIEDEEASSLVTDFETQLLTILGYWNNANYAQLTDTQDFIEQILERKLKSRHIFAKI